MKIDLKVALTVAVVGAFLVLLGTYLSDEYGGGDTLHVKSDIVVGDYISIHNYQSVTTSQSEGMDAELFFDYYFKADIEDMDYVSDVIYILDGAYIDCEEYRADTFTVYVTKESKMLVYSEYEEYDYIWTMELTECSLDVVEGFTADDIKAGMEFTTVSDATFEMRTETHFTIDEAYDGLLEYTVDILMESLVEYTMTVVAVEDDRVTLDYGAVMSKEMFLNILSKDYLCRDLFEGYEITSEDTYDREYEAEFGTFMAHVDAVSGNQGRTDMDAYVYYVGEDVFLKALRTQYTDDAIQFLEFEIVDTSMYV